MLSPTQTSKPTCSAVILAGGLNSRMGGKNKAFLMVGSKTILERLMQALSGLFEEIILVTRQPELYKGLPLRVVTDIYTARSSLTGIHAGLKNAKSDFAFVVPCDAPFIQIDLIRYLLSQLEPELDVIVPTIDDHYEPLCAIYSKRCIVPIEEQLDRDDYTIIHFFDRINLKTITGNSLQAADRRMLSFFNVNTPEVLNNSQHLVDKT